MVVQVPDLRPSIVLGCRTVKRIQKVQWCGSSGILQDSLHWHGVVDCSLHVPEHHTRCKRMRLMLNCATITSQSTAFTDSTDPDGRKQATSPPRFAFGVMT